MTNKTLFTLLAIFYLTALGCGGGGSSNGAPSTSPVSVTPPTTPPPKPGSPQDVSGPWSFTAKSSTTGNYFAVQANLTLQSTGVYFSSTGSTIFYAGTPDASGDGSIDAVTFATPCDLLNTPGPNKFMDTLNVTFSSQNQAVLQINEGLDYSANLQFSSDGNSVSGTYTTPTPPNYCAGAPPDSGTITGRRAAAFAGTYSGTLLAYCGEATQNDFGSHVCDNNNTPEAVVLAASETNGAVTLTGSSNNMPIIFSGNAVGGAFSVAGVGPFNGNGAGAPPVTGPAETGATLIGIYDPVANNFRVYSFVPLFEPIMNGSPTDEEFIGILGPGQ
jgi:hypothetical protein